MIEIYKLENFDKNKFINNELICAIGNFDGFHIGHQKILNDMKKLSKDLNNPKIVFISFFPNTKSFFLNKQNFLINTRFEKINLFEFFRIDILIEINFDNNIKEIEAENFIQKVLIEKIGIHSIFVGENFYFGKNKKGNIDLLANKKYKNYFNFYYINLKSFNVFDHNYEIQDKQISSSNIRNIIINNGNIELANKMLGYDFFLTGEVIHGFKRGREIGFPTANIILDHEKILPKFGVYSSYLYIFDDMNQMQKNFNILFNKNNNKLFSISNFGIKPTFSKMNSDNIENNPLLETHIFNFNFDIYGKFLIIFFKKFIRNEKKFNSIDDLKTQINLDIKKVTNDS
jgi:riboflavin kinase/FMN adenylyltransferase